MNSLEYINNKIIELEDELQHYTMVDKDKAKEFYIREDLKQLKSIKQDLEVLQILKNKKINQFWMIKCYTLKEWNNLFISKELTQEEFDLIKNWLGRN